jgi:hypothetical protein
MSRKEVATLHLTARGFDAFNLLNAKVRRCVSSSLRVGCC